MLSKFKQVFLGVGFIPFLLLSVSFYFIFKSTNNIELLITCGLSIFFILPCLVVLKQVYSWNNGTCRDTGKPWIEKQNYQDYREFISEDSKGNIFKISLDYLNIDYNDEEAKKINLHFKKISNLKAFD